MIVKFLGRKIRYKALETLLEKVWMKKRVISIMDLSNDYLQVSFTHEEDKKDVLADGSWFIYDH